MNVFELYNTERNSLASLDSHICLHPAPGRWYRYNCVYLVLISGKNMRDDIYSADLRVTKVKM